MLFSPFCFPIGGWKGVIYVSGHFPWPTSGVGRHKAGPLWYTQCPKFPDSGSHPFPLFPQAHPQPSPNPLVESFTVAFHGCRLKVTDPSHHVLVQQPDSFVHWQWTRTVRDLLYLLLEPGDGLGSQADTNGRRSPAPIPDFHRRDDAHAGRTTKALRLAVRTGGLSRRLVRPGLRTETTAAARAP
jgi:hypothetical protein